MVDEGDLNRVADKMGTSREAIQALTGGRVSGADHAEVMFGWLVPFQGSGSQYAVVFARTQTAAMEMVDTFGPPSPPEDWIPLKAGAVACTAFHQDEVLGVYPNPEAITGGHAIRFFRETYPENQVRRRLESSAFENHYPDDFNTDLEGSD